MISNTFNPGSVALPSIPAIKIDVGFIRRGISKILIFMKKIIINKYVGAFLTVWSGPIE